MSVAPRAPFDTPPDLRAARWAATQHGCMRSDQRLKRLIRKAQAEKRANVRQIAAVLRRARGHHRRTGSRRSSRPALPRPASGHDDVVLDVILEAGFTHPVANARLVVGGTPYLPDLRWPVQHLSLEIDSSPWHDGPLAQELDPTARPSSRPPASGCSGRRARAICAPLQLVEPLAAAGASRRGQNGSEGSYTDAQP